VCVTWAFARSVLESDVVFNLQMKRKVVTSPIFFCEKMSDNNYLEENPIKCYKSCLQLFFFPPTLFQTWLDLMWKQQRQQQPAINEVFKKVNFVLSLNGADSTFTNLLFSLTQNIRCTFRLTSFILTYCSTIKHVPLTSEGGKRSEL